MIFNGNGQSDFSEKILRLAAGAPLRVLDLFAGCGGMSLGFQRAGYTILGGVEKDPVAARTHTCNFFRGETECSFARHSQPRDITEFSPADFMREIYGVESPKNQVDVIVGGPPCQAFARIGRAKLREIMKHPQAYLNDSRADLYLHFLEYVEYFRPLVVLMENVPDIMNFGGKNIAHEIAATLDEMGYAVRYTILNAVHYGVPQYRMRFFLMAFLKDTDITPSFPEPTHQADVPGGYKNQAMGKKPMRAAAPYLMAPKDAGEVYYVPAPTANSIVQKAVTTAEALEDLPEIIQHLKLKRSDGTRYFDTLLPYRSGEDQSDYIKQMRMWPGFENDTGVKDHVIRYLPRDYETFKRMKPGDQYPQAYDIAKSIFAEKLRILEQESAEEIDPRSERYLNLWKACVPPYKQDRFPNKWWKLVPDQPSRTLTAHLGKDTYSHIHYDSDQARVISVREAARLQSFPDGFRFEGAMNAAFRQIGNAVPPLLAFNLAKKIKQLLEKAVADSDTTHQLTGLKNLFEEQLPRYDE